MQVTLTIKERQFAKEAGDARTEANKHKHDIGDYDHRRFNLSGLQANRLGVFAEAVAFKALGGNVLEHSLDEWAHYVPNEHPEYDRLIKQNADLFGVVEVRRANHRGNPLPIRPKDRVDGRLLLSVCVPYRQALPQADDPFPLITVGLHAFVDGWASSDEQGTAPAWSTTARVVTPKPMETFPWGDLSC